MIQINHRDATQLGVGTCAGSRGSKSIIYRIGMSIGGMGLCCISEVPDLEVYLYISKVSI